MKRKNLFLLSTLFAFSLVYAYAQRDVIVYDLVNETSSSFSINFEDLTEGSKSTPYYIGNFNSNIEILEQDSPTGNIYPESQYSYIREASLDHNLNNYPIRTSVKIFEITDSGVQHSCSGSLISRKHVLTAAHCYFNNYADDSDALENIPFKVCPAYDNGTENPNFGCSLVTKIYILSGWELYGGEDFAVLELEQPLGESAGWIGVGFDNDNSILSNSIFYKFSYPVTALPTDTETYTGEFLFYRYGKADYFEDTYIGFNNVMGAGGESGSSIINVVNNSAYVTYGVTTSAHRFMHSRISNDTFQFINGIIKDELSLSIDVGSRNLNIVVHPNPVLYEFQIDNLLNSGKVEIYIFDMLGRAVFQKNNYIPGQAINVSGLAMGSYNLLVKSGELIYNKKLIKK